MGVSNSRTYGGILVNLEKPNYYPGELVKGTVYLNMTMGQETRGLQVMVEGVEQTGLEVKLGTRNVTPYSGKNVLFEERFTIHTWHNNYISIGHYACPFTFTLPLNLPGSFEFYDRKCSASIKYVITAKLLSRDGYDDLTADSLLIVRTNPELFSYPANLSDTRNLSTWCCFDKGTASLNVSYPKPFYTVEEAINISCEINNTRCRLKSTSIRIQLIQQIRILTSGLLLNNPSSFKRIVSQTFSTKTCVSKF
jgi:hypothetical protein